MCDGVEKPEQNDKDDHRIAARHTVGCLREAAAGGFAISARTITAQMVAASPHNRWHTGTRPGTALPESPAEQR